MINKKDLKGFIISNLNSEHFLIDLSVSSSNQIQVFIDSMEGLPIIECVKYTKLIEEEFDRDVEDSHHDDLSPVIPIDGVDTSV